MPQQKIILIQQLKEGEVAHDYSVGISREMSPESLIFRSHYYLVYCLTDYDTFKERWKSKDKDKPY